MEPTTLSEIIEPPSSEPPAPPVDPIKSNVGEDKSKPLAERLAAIRAETLAQAQPQEPAQPVQPQATATPQVTAEVPEKFKKPDGTLDVAKVEQSTLSAEQVLEKYKQREADLKRKINEVNRLEKSLPPVISQAPAPQTPAQPQQPQTLAQMINADLAAGMTAGDVLAKWADAVRASAKEDVKREILGDVQAVKDRQEMDEKQRQLRVIGQSDPWVLTEQGMDTLFAIREKKPWLNAAPEPMEAAYRDYLATQAMSQRQGSQVQMPNPKGATAPVMPAAPVNRAPVAPALNPQTLSFDQINSHLAGKSRAEQNQFYKALGLPGLPGQK